MTDIDNNKKYLIIRALLELYKRHEQEKEVYCSLEVIRDVAHSHRENGTHLSYDEAREYMKMLVKKGIVSEIKLECNWKDRLTGYRVEKFTNQK